MKIKFLDSNRDCINADRIGDILDERQRRRRANLVEFEDLTALAATVEAELSRRRIPQKERVGTVADFRPAGPRAASYRGAQKTLVFTIQRGRGGAWFLTDLKDAEVYGGNNPARMRIVITPAAAKAAQAAAIAGLYIGVPFHPADRALLTPAA